MANTAIEITFYVAKAGVPLTGAVAQMNFESLLTLAGVDKSGSAPSISEIGGGWYKFPIAYGAAPFDAGDLVGVIDADNAGVNGLADEERYVAVEVKLEFYALARNVNKMTQNKSTGAMEIKNAAGNTILKLAVTDGESEVTRDPAVAT